MTTTTTISEIKVGDFIEGKYKYGYISGKVIKVLKNKVVITKYNQFYNEYTPTDQEVNVTNTRIYRVNPPDIIIK
jgi:hypothetical protein